VSTFADELRTLKSIERNSTLAGYHVALADVIFAMSPDPHLLDVTKQLARDAEERIAERLAEVGITAPDPVLDDADVGMAEAPRGFWRGVLASCGITVAFVVVGLCGAMLLGCDTTGKTVALCTEACASRIGVSEITWAGGCKCDDGALIYLPDRF
jgi:hypothetical protein